MRLLQLNCQSLNTSKAILQDYVDRHKIDLVCITETWVQPAALKFKNWTPIPLLHPKDQYGGAAILARPGVKIVRNSLLENDQDEFVWANVSINGKIHTIGSLYIRPGKFTHVQHLRNILIGMHPGQPLLLLGDFNARSLVWEHGTVTAGDDAAWRMGVLLEELCIEFNLKIHNTGRYTYVGCQSRNAAHIYPHKSAIDLSLSRNIDAPIAWRVDDLTVINSDHLPILMEIREQASTVVKTRWDVNNSDWSEFQISIDGKLSA